MSDTAPTQPARIPGPKGQEHEQLFPADEHENGATGENRTIRASIPLQDIEGTTRHPLDPRSQP